MTFVQEHKFAFGDDALPAVGGFPDNCNGRYTRNMEYKEWYDLNNSLRVYQNFIEMLPYGLVWLLIGGLLYPRYALGVAIANCIARPIYIK